MEILNPNDYCPGLSIDCVIFGFHDAQLKILLLKLKNADTWALPGGFIKIRENVDAAAVRILQERTGLSDIYLEQFHFFGDAQRAKENYADSLIEKNIIPTYLHDFFAQRFNTVGYYSLVEFEKVKKPTVDYISESCEWWPIEDMPALMIDHQKIFQKAYDTLKIHLSYQPIGLNLLPDKFTMPELQSLYETLLDKKLDRRNFQRKMLSFGILDKTSETRKGGAHKAPYLYKFNTEKYKNALREGWSFM